MAVVIGLGGTKILRFRDTTLGVQLSVPKGTQTTRHLRVRYAPIVERRRGYKTLRDTRSKLGYAFDVQEQERHRIARELLGMAAGANASSVR